jgi:hypothetical protein
LAVQCLLVLSLVRQWLNAGTYRLYLDQQEVPGQPPPRARQGFEIVGDRIQPQILSSDDEHLVFPVDFPWRSQLRLRAVPTREATLEIATFQDGVRRTLFRRTLSQTAAIVQPLPPITGRLELANHGEIRWSDPRVVHEPSAMPEVLGILALFALMAVLRAAGPPPPDLLWTPRTRSVLFAAVTAVITTSVCLAILELSLRAMARRLPAWIAVQRRDLGEVQRDPRWQDSSRYGSRLAPGIRTFCQWQQGDIVRMGFLPPDLVRHPPYRFAFATDDDGFRNSETTPKESEVAALGDSFTDAMTLPGDLTWPARLAALLDVSVRNYGTAGFGPPQELLVLKEYALPRRPRLVVVGFFAGNDLQDAERFATFVSDGKGPPPAATGWQFKRVIARFDQFYVRSLWEGLLGLWRERSRAFPDPQWIREHLEYSGEDPTASAVSRPSFDRGLFSVPVDGKTLRFAFLPPYLNCLKYSREELGGSRRWRLVRDSYQQMQQLVRAEGGELVVLFIPSKAQVYLPLLEASFPRPELREALRLCLRDQSHAPELEVLLRNRLVLNDLMRDFCARGGIAFLDLTAALESQVRVGKNMYFPDDSHWNAAGHQAAAEALAGFIAARRPPTRGQVLRASAGPALSPG